MAISTNQKPTIYRNLYENMDPGSNHTTTELINSDTTFKASSHINRWAGPNVRILEVYIGFRNIL